MYCKYRVAVVRDSSDLRPVVVSNAAGNHSSFAPSLPLVRRYTQMWTRAKYLSSRATSRELRIHRRSDMPPSVGQGSQITIGITRSVQDW